MAIFADNRRRLTTLNAAVGAPLLIRPVVLLPRASVHAQASAFGNFEPAQECRRGLRARRPWRHHDGQYQDDVAYVDVRLVKGLGREWMKLQ
jgi:hypothetical protein